MSPASLGEAEEEELGGVGHQSRVAGAVGASRVSSTPEVGLTRPPCPRFGGSRSAGV